MGPDQKRAQEVMHSIREILMRDWDPIGVDTIPEAADEYDSYIASVYRILVNTQSKDELVAFLYRTETETMGLSPRSQDHLQEVAGKLLSLDVSK
jgi:hypothetical protein